MTTDELLSLRVSTSDFPAEHAVEAFREIFGKAILRIEMEPFREHELKADMTLRALPNFGLGTGLMSPSRNTHTGQLVDSDDIVLVWNQGGYAEFERAGDRAELFAGDVIVTSIGDAASFTVPVETRATNLRFSREMLTPYLADLGANLSAPKLKQGTALRLLTHYASVLEDGEALASPELRHAVVTHLHELAALAMGANRDGEQAALRHGVRAARLRAIKADILQNLARHDLSLRTIAARHGVTPRYVGMLFESEPETLSEYVLAQRLARAHRMLGDPRHAARTISAVAYECGFGDLSYFNRSFRRRYGMTPSDLRKYSESLKP